MAGDQQIRLPGRPANSASAKPSAAPSARPIGLLPSTVPTAVPAPAPTAVHSPGFFARGKIMMGSRVLRSVIERAGIDHRLNVALGAKHGHQVADHRRLSLVVKL